MARKDLLPSYLSQQAWRDMCDAIDAVFDPLVDTPTNNLGKIRRPRLFNQTTTDKINNATLISQTDLDTFEEQVLVKQVNTSGLTLSDPDKLGADVKARFFRNLPHFWYSKGTTSVADFLSYVLNTQLVMKRLWTTDYVTFLPEGDVGIGTPIYSGGTWYPTTHTQVEVDAGAISGSVDLGVFTRLFESLCNYPLVPQYVIIEGSLWLITTGGRFMGVVCGGNTEEHETLSSFALTGLELSSGAGEGGFEALTPVALPGPGGTGYTTPAVPVPDFTASVTSGAAPLSVTFTNTTTGYVISRAWDFNGDGVWEDFTESPVHIYTVPGIYTVKLSAINPGGIASMLKTAYITVT